MAVALQFDKGKMSAPLITAKGRGLVAEKIIEVAREEGVPVVEDGILVEAMDLFEVGQAIPPELYHVVAEILVTVYKAEKNAKA